MTPAQLLVSPLRSNSLGDALQSVFTPGVPLGELLRPREQGQFAEQLRRMSARSTPSTREAHAQQTARSDQSRGSRLADSNIRSAMQGRSSSSSEIPAEARGTREATGAPPSARSGDVDSSDNRAFPLTQHFSEVESATYSGMPTQPMDGTAQPAPSHLQSGYSVNDLPHAQGSMPQGLQEYFAQSTAEHSTHRGTAQSIPLTNSNGEHGASHTPSRDESLPATIPPQLLQAWETLFAQQQNPRAVDSTAVPRDTSAEGSTILSEQGLTTAESAVAAEQAAGNQSDSVTSVVTAATEAEEQAASQLAEVIESKLKESMQEEEAPSAGQATKLLIRKLAGENAQGEEPAESSTETKNSAVPPWAQAQQQAQATQAGEQPGQNHDTLPVTNTQEAVESARNTHESSATVGTVSTASEQSPTLEGLRSTPSDAPEGQRALEQATSLGRETGPRAEGVTPRGGTPTATLDTSKPDLATRLSSYLHQAGDSGKALRIRLNPPELGTLQIEVSRQAGQMTARVEVESPQARALLLEQAHLLRDSLQAQGIRLERFDVELNERMSDSENSRKSSEEEASQGDSNQQHSQQQQSGKERQQQETTQEKTASHVAESESTGASNNADVMDVSV